MSNENRVDARALCARVVFPLIIRRVYQSLQTDKLTARVFLFPQKTQSNCQCKNEYWLRFDCI